MDDLREQIELLESSANLSTSIDDVQKTIDLLTAARAKIAADPKLAPLTLAKLQDPFKKSLDVIQKDLKPIYAGLNKYGKALDKKFKDKPLPSPENDALSSHPSLINRAIAMHLLREGQFDVASTFVEEANRHPPRPEPTPNNPDPYIQASWEKDLAEGTFNSERLQQQFADMYNILHQLRVERNLKPAIQWARERSELLEARGSNLEFELCRLQFVCLFDPHKNQEADDDDDAMSDSETPSGPLDAWAYARREFAPFQKRYHREIQQLLGAMAFWQNIQDSPYARLFYNNTAWEEVAHSFNREFCSLLGLSADSPLFIAATAGAIALPYLLKMQSIMKEKRTEWTTQDELPVEIPLPSQYHFHSIFVCPVSKEQSTDTNPPMMMPCGHVIAQESLDKLSKGQRFKCPYCPNESHPRDARKVVL
ncbi:regulator of gluconeogenesis protein [Pyrenophora tritici-repentis]|uniref:GID complex catalytic subunit 2 n=1 Tax=Pyrenophora tritici-repentis TaxID=45151 RepID=A0A2W1E271_9PLEO|nr:CLTH multi-domain protein [Pyrenophora tritici-repentis]KAF7446844.1 CLTH multi-domain protein [Pyrenophora tritici-repentis]KAF7569119.1 CLTH multi-domain protein [Pyrenophora tritici-repentis]KAG9383080.1 CLTH multi-domain protein [Pyrenophora tritici-repentis]KAI0588594.1 CLTH multi-domain protein [Pyrenophora tritici-repentis]